METQFYSSTLLPKHRFRSSQNVVSSSYMIKNINLKNIRTITAKQKKTPLLANNILNTLDGLICNFLDPPLQPAFHPKTAMLGNYEPVGEVPPVACPVVVGSLPPSLDGAYIRNGPNPQFIPKGPYHVLDGDGMLHMVRISGGRPTFCSRFIKTHKYETEREIGSPVVPNFVSSFNGIAASMARSAVFVARVLLKQIDPSEKGMGVANTSVAVLSGGRRLFALCESDLPYEIKLTDDGDIATLGRHRFHSVEPSFYRMTAHPKVDRETGEAFAYQYDTRRPFLTFYRIDREGRKQKDVPINSKKDCTVLHDFGLTENHVVFPDIQLVINPMWIFRSGSPVGIDGGKTPRLGIIPRYAEDESEMEWVDAPGLNMLHCLNAWEEDGGDKIVMVVTNHMKVDHIISQAELSEPTLEKVTVDMKTKIVRRQRLSPIGSYHELGTVNPAYANKKIRYVYIGLQEESKKVVTGVEKFDLSMVDGDCMVASRMYGTGCYGNEPFFVAKEPNNLMAEEDDGYIVTYVHDENTEESRFLVMDAKSSDLDVIAAVKLPQRVPAGFHGLFLLESELNKLGKL